MAKEKAKGDVDVLPAEDDRLMRVTQVPSDLMTTAKALAEIATQADADAAGEFLRGVRTRIRQIKAGFKELRDDINEAIRKNRVKEEASLKPFLEVDAVVSAPLETWLKEQKRLADEENARRLREAEERAKREQEEAAAAIRRAAVESPTKREAESLERQARQVEKAQPLPVMTETVVAPKVKGVPLVTELEAVVTNTTLLVKGVLDGKVPYAAITINQGWLNTEANRRGKDLNFPGVVVREKSSLRARGL